MSSEKEKITVRRFKDNRKMFWVEYRVYWLTDEGRIILCSGVNESEIHKETLIKYLKRNKLL